MFTTCAVWIFILTYKVELFWCRPRQLVGEVEPPWTSLLTQFENLFDDKISTVVETLFPKTPQFHSEFCGTSPVMSKVPTAKIVGGQEAKSGQFPWQAALILLPEGGRGSRLTCGGTIITAMVVLTAAHCLHFPPHSYQVLVGRVSSNLGAEEAHQQKLSVVKYLKHPQFEARVYKNDIALLYVKSPYGQGMWWNDWVLPACLFSSPSHDMYEENIVGTVSGWGLVEEGGYEVSPTLQHVDVHIHNIGYCQDSFSSVTSFSEDNQFCAGEQGGGRDSCSGDSGGPFLVEEKGTGRYFVSGVVSYGVGCGRSRYPGVYTRVDMYVTWVVGEVEKMDMGMEGKVQKKDQVLDLQLNDLLQVDTDFMDKVKFVELLQPFLSTPPTSYSVQPVCADIRRVISCESSSHLKIIQAFFGRENSKDCPVPWLPSEGVFSCSHPSALSDLQIYCDGKRTCTLTTTTRDVGGPFSTNPCILQEPFVKLEFICVNSYSSEHSELGNNLLDRRAYDEVERESNPEVGIQMEVDEFADFPDKKSAAWHSRPWERSLRGEEGKSNETSHQDGQRVRFLV